MVPDDLIQHALRRLARTIAVGGSGHARHKREAHATPDGRRDPRNLRHDALFCRSPCLGILGGRSQNFQCLRRPPWAPRCETHEDATWPRLAPRPSVASPSLGESLASEAEVDGVRIGVICEVHEQEAPLAGPRTEHRHRRAPCWAISAPSARPSSIRAPRVRCSNAVSFATRPSCTATLVGPVPARRPVDVDFVGRPLDEQVLFRIASAHEGDETARHLALRTLLGPLATQETCDRFDHDVAVE